jgi:hypothetical protein
MTSFSGAASSTYSTTIEFSKSLRLISAHEGRFPGVRLRHRFIKSSIPGENNPLDKIGFLVGSKEGSYLAITL